MVYSASSALALKKFGSDFYFLKKQALFSLLGIVALVMCRHFPYRLFKPLAYPILLAASLMILALARPQAVISLPRLEGTVILAFDVSGSMGWNDKLSLVKYLLTRALDHLDTDDTAKVTLVMNELKQLGFHMDEREHR